MLDQSLIERLGCYLDFSTAGNGVMEEVELNAAARETPSKNRDYVSGESLLHIEQLADI